MASPTSTQFAVAVHVLGYLASVQESGDDRAVGATELAESTDVTPVHVRRVLAPLRRAGLIASTPGAGGGWRLLREPADVTLSEVWRLVRGDGQVLAVHGPNPDCPVGRGVQSRLETLDVELSGLVDAHLAATTVADLAQDV